MIAIAVHARKELGHAFLHDEIDLYVGRRVADLVILRSEALLWIEHEHEQFLGAVGAQEAESSWDGAIRLRSPEPYRRHLRLLAADDPTERRQIQHVALHRSHHQAHVGHKSEDADLDEQKAVRVSRCRYPPDDHGNQESRNNSES